MDISEALTRWQAEGREGDARAFIDWVLATQADEQVMVTEILPSRLTGARAATFSTDPTVIASPAETPGAAATTATVVTTPPGDPASAATLVTGTDAPSTGATDAAATMEPASRANTRYVIIGEAGKGGMAVVHVARDIDLMRSVALKRLAGGIAAHEEVQARFLREVQISAQLDHPNIVPVYGLEMGDDGVPAYAMKLVRGRTLEHFLGEVRAFYQRDEQPDEAHNLATRLEHFLKVCDAMAYAHDKGVVHRDLKPANVMIGRHNEIYVMDWGICRVLRLPDSADLGGVEVDAGQDTDADTRTRMGTIVGTARYMAPEQAQGRTDQVGPASDQYSLGLMLYEIATLQSPYEGRTVVDVIARAARAEVRPVRHAFPAGSVPRELAAIIGRATAADPERRYAGVRALAADVRRYMRGEEIEARPDTLWQKAARRAAQHRQAMVTAFVVLIAAASLLTAALLYRHERALVAADVRERAMLVMVDHVAQRASLLQTRLLELQGEVDALASTTGLALQHGTASNDPFYWIDDFSNPARRPPDLVDADGQSFTYGAWVPAAGANRARLVPQIRRVLNARHYRNELFDRARLLFGRDRAGGDATAPADLQHSGVEVFLLGLASGVTVRLPGQAGSPHGPDPRQERWYQLASGTTAIQWGEPYALTDGEHLLLPVSQAIRADDGRELGVASLLLSLDLVIENLLRVGEHPAVRATLLLDADGRVIAAEGDLPTEAADATDLMLQPFPDPGLHEALRLRDTGYVATRAFGRDDIAAFGTVQPLGWALVKVAAEDAVLAASDGP